MVEPMYERSPNYFKQFQKQFKFQIVEEKRTLSNTNVYAVCAHFDSEFCGLVTNYYHVLLDTTTFGKETLERNQNSPVPCIFTTFIFNCNKFGDKWRRFDKAQTASFCLPQ